MSEKFEEAEENEFNEEFQKAIAELRKIKEEGGDPLTSEVFLNWVAKREAELHADMKKGDPAIDRILNYNKVALLKEAGFKKEAEQLTAEADAVMPPGFDARGHKNLQAELERLISHEKAMRPIIKHMKELDEGEGTKIIP